MTRSREATLRLIGRVPERDLTRPRTQGRWSVKDVLAHFAAWEEEAIRRFGLIARGRGDRIFFYVADPKAVDRFNARAVAAARRLSLPGVLRRLARVRERLLRRLRALPAAALRDPVHRYPVTSWLPEYAWTHEGKHRRRLRKWWRERQTGGAGRPDSRGGKSQRASAGGGAGRRKPREP